MLCKFAHFILVKSTHGVVNIGETFLKEIYRLHRVPKMVISKQVVKLTANFRKPLFAKLETKINFSTSYHP